MEKRTFTLDSSDGKSKLSGFLFLPEHKTTLIR